MAKKKPNQELINLSELARRAGCTRQAVSMWIKYHEDRGIALSQLSGRKGKLVDAGGALVQGYIKNSLGKSNRQQNDEAGDKSPNTLRKLRYQTEKLGLQNTTLRGKYITRETAWALCDKLLEFEREAYAHFADSVLERIEDRLKIKIERKARQQAKELLDQAVQKAHETSARIVQDFKKETAPKHDPKKTA